MTLFTSRFRRGVLLPGILAACALTCPAIAQTVDPAPYLHTPPLHTPPFHTLHRAQVKHVAIRKKPVPVISPRLARAPRRAARPLSPIAEPVKPKAAVTPAKKPPAPALPADIGSNSGLHLPRYAALKSDDVNMRSGPGERYPVLWTYQRRDLPVKIEREFDIWRQVEDMDGIKGWMQEGFLTGHRSFVITGTEDRTLRSDASETAGAVAILKPGVVGRIRSCDAGQDWCQVQVQDYRGWLRRADFWGTDPGEAITP